MSDIKLEVGQVWKDEDDREIEILKVYSSVKNKSGSSIEPNMAVHMDRDYDVCTDRIEWLTQYCTLITNSDGTPHFKPNDYQAGDVWVFYGTGRTPGSAHLIISGHNGLMVLCDYKKDATPMEEMSLIANPTNYKLIHRIGVIL